MEGIIMKFVIQNRKNKEEIFARFNTNEEAQNWVSFCIEQGLIDLSQGSVSIVDVVEGKEVGQSL
jgi:hypothetical protein